MADRIYVESKVNDSIILPLDKERLLGLDKGTIERTDLFLFSMALGVHTGKRTPLSSKKDIALETAVMNNDRAMSAMFSLLVDELRKTSEDEKIGDKDLAYGVAQEYANTGFQIIGEWLKNLKIQDEESIVWSLISELDKKYESIFGESI